MQSVTSGVYPSDQIFPKKGFPTKTGVMTAIIHAKHQFAFVFEKCPKMHHQK